MTTYPLHLLPEPLRSYVREAAESIDCDPSYVAAPLLACVAGAIGNSRACRPKRGFDAPPTLWTAVVALSGTAKSPAFDAAVKFVREHQRRIIRNFNGRKREYDDAVKAWKRLPRDERGDEPESPTPMEHPLCGDITIEAVARRHAATPRGMTIVVDELRTWFGSFDRYRAGGADEAHWLTLYDAKPLKIDRVTDDRMIYVPRAAVSVTGTIQPDTLRRALVPEYFESGLAARLLLVMPPLRCKQWTEREVSDEADESMRRLFAALYALRLDAGPDGDEPRNVRMNDAAQATWIVFYDAHNKAMELERGPIRAALAKIEGIAARLALIFHVVRQATGETDNDFIDSCDIEAGIALARWHGEETRRVYAALSRTDEERERDDLLAWIAGRGGRVTERDLERGPREYRGNAVASEAALQALVDAADGSWTMTGSSARGGRPVRTFVMAEHPDFPIVRRGDGDTTRKIQ